MKFESISEDKVKTPEKKRLSGVKKACVGAAAIAALSFFYMVLPGSLENELRSLTGTTNVEPKGTTEAPVAEKITTIDPDLTEYILLPVNDQPEPEVVASNRSGSVTIGVVVPGWYICNKEHTKCITNIQCGDVPCEVITQKQIDNGDVIVANRY